MKALEGCQCNAIHSAYGEDDLWVDLAGFLAHTHKIFFPTPISTTPLSSSAIHNSAQRERKSEGLHFTGFACLVSINTAFH